MADPQPVKSQGLIRSRIQAERAAAGSTAASGLMAFMFALGALTTWGSPAHPYLGYAIWAALAGACAFLMDRRKSITMACVIFLAAVLLTVWAVFTGHGKLLGWLGFILPAAVTGLQGARALKRSDLPRWV